jgi:3alpha(or 20beta)-hydroxysteroid dehydrogenase
MLNGKVALLTGAANGLGAATARRFSAEGASVALSDVDEHGVAAVGDALDGPAMAAKLDVGDEAAWAEFVAKAKEAFGHIDILVNNAGIFRPGSIAETDAARVEEMFRTNQLGTHLGIRAVADAMREAGGGSIVNVSSAGGVIGAPNIAAYGPTKWAVRGLSKNAAAELAADNIRVNCVLPGLFESDMAAVNTAEAIDEKVAITPLGRMGTVEEVVAVNVFLASDESSYMTGAEILVDGGATIGP